jgi:translocator protein
MKVLRIANIVGLLIMLATNALASATELIGGQQTAEVSDRFPTLFTPAGYVFSIWGVIYVALIVFAIYQARSMPEADRVVQRIGPWFAINAILNAAWLFFWGAELLWISVAVMLGILVSLIVIYEHLGIGRTRATTGERWLVRVPFSIYLGWISVATIANISVALVASGFDGYLPSNILGPQYWFVLMVTIATVLGLLAAVWRRDAAFAMVFVWAFAGIAVNLGPQPDYAYLDLFVSAAAVVVALGALVGLTRRRGEMPAAL